MHCLIAGIVGLASGISCGFFGVGGGVIMVPAMVLPFSPPIRDIKQAAGTSLVVIIPAALMSWPVFVCRQKMSGKTAGRR